MSEALTDADRERIHELATRDAIRDALADVQADLRDSEAPDRHQHAETLRRCAALLDDE